MRRCTGVTSTSWGPACSASCALASCNWRGARSGHHPAPRPHHPARLACSPTLLPATVRFLPDARLLRMRRKDWRSDFLSDFTRDSGPSMARESLGCRVHLGTQASHQGSTGPAAKGQTSPSGVLRGRQCPHLHPMNLGRGSLTPTWPARGSFAGSQRGQSRDWSRRLRGPTQRGA